LVSPKSRPTFRDLGLQSLAWPPEYHSEMIWRWCSVETGLLSAARQPHHRVAILAINTASMAFLPKPYLAMSSKRPDPVAGGPLECRAKRTHGWWCER